MKTLRHLCLVSLLATLPAFVRGAETAVPFRQLSLEDASKTAAAEGKLVFIDFYTTWCGPCKMLDEQTWTDAKVGNLIGEKAVALKLDAEKEGAPAAKRYKVSAYPTLLLLKADGSEVDRIVGFREPAAFALEFRQLLALAQSGKSALAAAREQVAQQARPEVASGEPEEAQPHFDLAKKLLTSGQSEEALKELLWCWDEGKKDPEFSRTTRSYQVPRELGRLAHDFPPAREAMIVRRDQVRERALANKGGTVVIQDLIALNRELKLDEDTLEVFDKMPEGDRRRVTVAIYLFDLLVEKQRYKDAMLFNMSEAFTRPIEMAKVQAKKGGPAADAITRSTITRTAKRIEALAGTGSADEARELGAQLLSLDSSPETKALLAQHAARAGHPELFKQE
jgi:thiol-disulfide isomerase/thioredoxin